MIATTLRSSHQSLATSLFNEQTRSTCQHLQRQHLLQSAILQYMQNHQEEACVFVFFFTHTFFSSHPHQLLKSIVIVLRRFPRWKNENASVLASRNSLRFIEMRPLLRTHSHRVVQVSLLLARLRELPTSCVVRR